MIGYQILAIEKKDDEFLADKVNPYFSVLLNINNLWDDKDTANEFYNLFGKKDSDKEFKLTKNDLINIKNSHTTIKGKNGYHKYACDGLIIIPKTKDKFIKLKDFLKLFN